MATVEFEEGVDEALDGHFAGEALRKVVEAYGDAEWLGAVNFRLCEDVPTVDCVFHRSRAEYGGVVVASLGEGYVHLLYADGDGEIRSVMFRTEAAGDHGNDYIRSISRPWSEEAFLGRLREALELWRPAMKPEPVPQAALRDLKVASARARRERLAAKVRSGEWTVERFLVEGIGIPPEKVELYKPHVVI